MKPDFFTNLPSEITTNILSRLPLRSVAISKCVCKPWRDLIESDYFIKFRISEIKIPPALAVLMPARNSTRCTIFDFEDEFDPEGHHLHNNPVTDFDFPFEDSSIEGTAADILLLLKSEPPPEIEDEDEDEADLKRHDRHYKSLTNLDFPFGESSMKGTTANGFLLLYSEPANLYICNPLTREYVSLCLPQVSISADSFTCGFGVSKISGQHKVVFINQADAESKWTKSYHVFVYTLGTGLWRCVKMFECEELYCSRIFGKFVNGNLHWAAWDPQTPEICCFDVETERISFFSGPPIGMYAVGELSVLRECLCVCTNTKGEDIDVFLMKEYGVEESWTIEYEMIFNPGIYFDREEGEPLCPIKVFKDGDILMLWDDQLLVYYSNKTKTTQQLGMFNDGPDFTYGIIFTPRLLSLKSFGMENVISF